MSEVTPTSEGTGRSRDSQNLLFTALSNHRRRFTLYACHQADGELTLSDVAEQVAAWEYDKPVEAVTSDERKRVYTSLQQHHLTKLEDAGLIEFDGDTITLTEKAERIDLYLEIVTDDTIPWSLYYLGLALIGGIGIIVTYTFEVPDPVTPGIVGLALMLLLTVSSIAHFIDTRRKHLDDAETSAPGI